MHSTVPFPSVTQMNHVPRMAHYQNHMNFNNVIQNGNNHYPDSSTQYNNINNDNSANAGNGGSGEYVSSNSNIINDIPSLNMGGKNYIYNKF